MTKQINEQKENHNELGKRSNSNENSAAFSKLFDKSELGEENSISLRIKISEEEGEDVIIDSEEDIDNDMHILNNDDEGVKSMEDVHDLHAQF